MRSRVVAVALALPLAAGCASGALKEAKDAYNRGDFAAAESAARRLDGDPQAHLIAARAGLHRASVTDGATLQAVAADLKAASRGYPFPDEWANRELAAGVADWLMGAGLPELADLYYRGGLEAAGDDLTRLRAQLDALPRA